MVAALTGLVCAAKGVRGAWATRRSVEGEVTKLVGGATAKIGKITFDMSEIAEDGDFVFMGFAVDSPMTETDYVKAVHVFAELNPNPHVATFHLSPLSGRAQVDTRIRLAKSQRLVAVAQMSDGSFYRAEKFIKVTVGGCGGSN